MKVKLEQVSFDNVVSCAGRTSASFHSDDFVSLEADLDTRLIAVSAVRGDTAGLTEWVPFEQVKSMRPVRLVEKRPEPRVDPALSPVEAMVAGAQGKKR